jgi:cell division protein FtsB
MRDISRRLRRYRLSRYGASETPLWRRVPWFWPLLGLWGVYAVFVSEHSVWRVWNLGSEARRSEAELQTTRAEVERLTREIDDPKQSRELAERVLRERNGFASPDETVYRFEGEPDDSL